MDARLPAFRNESSYGGRQRRRRRSRRCHSAPPLPAVDQLDGDLRKGDGAHLQKAAGTQAVLHAFAVPHIYEHPHCIAGVVVEREWRREDAVFIGFIAEPEKKSLREIDTRIRFMKRAKVEALGSFRRLIRNTAYPLPFRRLLWRITLYGSGRLRAATCGTFWVNSIRARDVQVTQSFALVALSWFLTPVKPSGGMTLQVFFDHRVIDGVTVKRVVNEIEATLNGQILAELRAQSSRHEQRDTG
jgi:hypothetical protein